MRRVPSITIQNDLSLGNYPDSLSTLTRTIIEKTTPAHLTDHFKLTLCTSWFDFSLLTYLAQLLSLARDRFADFELSLNDPATEKIGFLWRCGFWQYVGANTVGSALICKPDIWRLRPDTSGIPTNFTEIFHLNTKSISDSPIEAARTDTGVADFVKRVDDSLRSTACFPVVRYTDAMQSREYLYLLLWELVHNSFVHSQGQDVAVAAQLFLSPSDIASWQEQTATSNSTVAKLSIQHATEIDHTTLPERTKWLTAHREHSFLLLSCTDCGIGIPESIRNHLSTSRSSSDVDLLLRAFSPWSSSRRYDPNLYDMHGLSQILRVVNEYDGYFFTQSGEAYAEFSQSAPLHSATAIPKHKALSGTLFQILLPLTAAPGPRPKVHTSRASRHGRPEAAEPEKRSVVVVGELRRAGLAIPPIEKDWHLAASAVQNAADRIAFDPLYLDLIRIPCDRQFVSYLLRSVRRTRPHSHAVIAINVPQEIFAFSRGMKRIDLNFLEDGNSPWNELDNDLAFALSRGELGCLPLLLPMVMSAPDDSSSGIVWLGLGNLSNSKRQIIEAALNHLIALDGEPVTWAELLDVLNTGIAPTAISLNDFAMLLEGIVRCNPSLFDRTRGGCRALVSPFELHRRSVASLETEVRRLTESIQHMRPISQQQYL